MDLKGMHKIKEKYKQGPILRRDHVMFQTVFDKGSIWLLTDGENVSMQTQ